MGDRIRVGLIFGGRSGEHEVSLMSASSVYRYIDRERFEVVPIGVNKEGKWMLAADAVGMLERGVTEDAGERVAIVPEPSGSLIRMSDAGTGVATRDAVGNVDVVFPLMHGTYGEDGTVQGLLELADIPYVGSGVLASSVGMDKHAMKRLFRETGLPVVNFETLMRRDVESRLDGVVEALAARLRLPIFVKPANLGSSVGVTKVKNLDDLGPALQKACLYDRKVIAEEAVEDAREIECAVLGNDDPVASPPGEIIPSREFYDYVAKYLDPATQLIVPAEVPAGVAGEIQRISIEAFKCIDAAGLARVDFFVERGTNRIWLNEINTIPGFTAVSMYPRMIQAMGISYTDLITRLIELAIERQRDKARRVTTYSP
ncbi:MAG: D-alanine--D-alanine ligase family protein [Ignavibacteriales bacterium]